jgi:hypothetical protein
MCCVGFYCWIIYTSEQCLKQWWIYWSQFTIQRSWGLNSNYCPELRWFTYTVPLNGFMTVRCTEARYVQYVQCNETTTEGLTINIKTAVFNKYWNIYKTYVLNIMVLVWQVPYYSSKPMRQLSYTVCSTNNTVNVAELWVKVRRQ